MVEPPDMQSLAILGGGNYLGKPSKQYISKHSIENNVDLIRTNTH